MSGFVVVNPDPSLGTAVRASGGASLPTRSSEREFALTSRPDTSRQFDSYHGFTGGGRGFLALLILVLASLIARAEPAPKLNELSTTWVQRGTNTLVVFEGQNIGEVRRFIVSGDPGVSLEAVPDPAPVVAVLGTRGGITNASTRSINLRARVTVQPEAGLGPREVRVVTPGGVSNPLTLNVSWLHELTQVEPNHTTNQAAWVELPVAISGTLREGAQVDFYRFKAQKGQRLIFDVQANRFSSPLDPSLGLLDATGKELQRGEDENGLDAMIDFTVPEAGEYQLALRDFRYQGGKDYKYRLLVGALPYVDAIFPFGAQRGQTVEVALRGRNLDGTEKLSLAIAPDAPLGAQDVQFQTQRGFSNSRIFDVGDVAEFTEVEPNNATNQANVVTLPVSINGRIQGEKDVDTYKFTVPKDAYYVFEVQANRFGSPLDALLTLSDAKGNVLQRNDDTLAADSRIEQRFGEAGEYFLSVRDLLWRQGENFGYRLTARVPAPDFNARLLGDRPRLFRGGRLAVRVEVDRLAGFDGSVEVVAHDLPSGVSLESCIITPELGGAMLMLTASEDAALGVAPLKLAALGVLGARRVERPLQAMEGDSPVRDAFLTVVESAPFRLEPLTLSVSLDQNQSAGVEVLVHRRPGYNEEVNLSLQGYSTGREEITRSLETAAVTLKGLETRGTVNLKAKLDSELGTRPFWVRAEGKVNGETVSVISRPLTLTLREFPFVLANSIPRASVTPAAPGIKSAASESEFSVKASRRGWFTEDISLAVEGVPEGIQITSTNLARGVGEATFHLTATEKAPAGKEFSLIVVGTANLNGRAYQLRGPELKLIVNTPVAVEAKLAPSAAETKAEPAKTEVAKP